MDFFDLCARGLDARGYACRSLERGVWGFDLAVFL